MSPPRLVTEGYELVPVDSLVPHPRNPRKGDVDAIAGLIQVNGFVGALVVQRSSSTILAGEHRWRAAMAEGITEGPVLWVDVDGAGARRILLADNRAADLGTYDEAALVSLLDDLASADNLAGTGYTEADVDDLLASLRADPDPPPPPPDPEPERPQRTVQGLREATLIYDDAGHARFQALVANLRAKLGQELPVGPLVLRACEELLDAG